MFLSLTDLTVSLKAVAHFVQESGHDGVAYLVSLLLQLVRQFPEALASPAKRRLGIPTSKRRNQTFQICYHSWVDS